MPITIPTSSIPLIPQVRDYVNSIEEVQIIQQAPPLAFAPRTSPHRAHVAASGRTYHGCTSQRTYEAATAWFSAGCFAACVRRILLRNLTGAGAATSAAVGAVTTWFPTWTNASFPRRAHLAASSRCSSNRCSR